MKGSTTLLTRAYRLGRICLHVVAGLATIAIIFPRSDRARRDRLIRVWGAKVLGIFAVRMSVDAPPGFEMRTAKRLFVGNHVSWLDIWALQALTASRFVAKSELAAWPVLGRLIRDTGTIFIERVKRSDTRRINSVLTAHLEAGDIIAVFPEGTTSDGRDVRKFHANIFQAALNAEAQIVPFCLRYTDPRGRYTVAPAYIDDLTFWDSVKLILREPRLHCELTIFSPLDTTGRDRRQLALAAETLVRQRLQGHTRQDR